MNRSRSGGEGVKGALSRASKCPRTRESVSRRLSAVGGGNGAASWGDEGTEDLMSLDLPRLRSHPWSADMHAKKSKIKLLECIANLNARSAAKETSSSFRRRSTRSSSGLPRFTRTSSPLTSEDDDESHSSEDDADSDTSGPADVGTTKNSPDAAPRKEPAPMPPPYNPPEPNSTSKRVAPRLPLNDRDMWEAIPAEAALDPSAPSWALAFASAPQELFECQVYVICPCSPSLRSVSGLTRSHRNCSGVGVRILFESP